VRVVAALAVANGAVVATWFALRAAWFDGSVGCDDSDPPQPPGCDLHGDVLTWIALAEVAFLAISLLLVAGLLLRRGGSLRARRRPGASPGHPPRR
jgi:hypothetical protein